MPHTIFWDVDTQVDFIDPHGKLYVPGAEQIVENLKRLTEFARKQHIPVIASADAHQPGDPEFAQYPPHCLAGTAGQKKIPETGLPDEFTVPNRPIDLPADVEKHQQIVIEKQKLDVFTNPNTEALLRRFTPAEIVLYGVVTELCVACAGRGLASRGYKLRVVTDAVQHLDEGKARGFLDELTKLGAKLVSTDEVVGAKN
jgi:nicotinamidase/pyrazinamidase